jgi:phosphoribosyl-ATP pyrophosphohydrolase/phosphoribosyl-AMP cyclohydrolase
MSSVLSATVIDASKIDWAKSGGLVPAVIQDSRSGRVLMLGYMNEDALRATLGTSLVTFFSRSKGRLWQKGESSGHFLRVRDIKLDCDGDTLLVLAEPNGPTCHLGTRSCFGDDIAPLLATLSDLADTIRVRRMAPPDESYTARLFAAGTVRIAQKVGEEAVETALAAATESPTVTNEAADLLYHLLVLLEARDLSLWDVLKILKHRVRR